jgi:hypothetical protein
MNYTEKANHETAREPAAGKGLTQKQRKILEKTMERHDAAFRKLAQM